MTEAKPIAALVRQEGSDRWRIELRDLKAFRQTLGTDVVNGFCRCFVHADRLTSLFSFASLNQTHYEETSPAFTRNLQTMAWFAVGTLRELALALRDLRSALKKQGMLDLQSKPWQALREIEKRWDDDRFFRDMRNTMAFHVDRAAIEGGLTTMEEDGNVIFCEGDGKTFDRSSMSLGMEALLRGCAKDQADFVRFIKTVRADHGSASEHIQEAFMLAIESKSIPCKQVAP